MVGNAGLVHRPAGLSQRLTSSWRFLRPDAIARHVPQTAAKSNRILSHSPIGRDYSRGVSALPALLIPESPRNPNSRNAKTKCLGLLTPCCSKECHSPIGDRPPLRLPSNHEQPIGRTRDCTRQSRHPLQRRQPRHLLRRPPSSRGSSARPVLSPAEVPAGSTTAPESSLTSPPTATCRKSSPNALPLALP